MSDLAISRLAVSAPAAEMDALARFYDRTLGLAARHADERRRVFDLGHSVLELTAAADGSRPFHHFAFLVPGDRFEAAHAWIAGRADLLDTPGPGGPVMDFPAWSAQALYFLDPAGNVVELIAHDAREGPTAAFSAAELLGVSEIGLVVDDPADAARALERECGLKLWSGGVEGPDALGFVGERAHTLILVPPGRGWLPTWRAAEAHPVEVEVAVAGAGRGGRALLTGGVTAVSTEPAG